jgi:hypothetical protein
MKILRLILPADKPRLPLVSGSWASWTFAILFVFLEASEARIRRLEQLNAQLATEVDKLRREHGEQEAAA